MFDLDLADVDAVAASDRLAASRVRVMAAEAEQLYLAAHWADLHAPEFVADCRALLPGTTPERGREGVRRFGADGCPEMAEFAGAELAALLGRSTASGESLIADAVTLRHRHSRLWRMIREGRVRVWLAVRVARRCAAAELTQDQAGWVDAQVAPYVETLPPGRLLALVEAKIIEVDPAAAAERAEAEALRRFVRVGRTDEQGLRTLVARARAGEVTVLVAVLDRIAAVLAERGDTDPVDVRRTTALRVLANPVEALELLATSALDAAEEAGQTGDGGGGEGVDEGVDGMVDVEGRPLPRGAVRGDLTPVSEPALPATGQAPLWGSGTEVPGEAPERILGLDDREVLGRLVDELGRHRDRLRPVCVFHVHTSRAALGAGDGLARVEELGPTTLAELRDWLAAGPGTTGAAVPVRLLPVLDPDRVPPVDRYEIPATMRRAVDDLQPYDAFPFGTTRSRACDADHVAPYRRGEGETGSPSAQTTVANLVPLSRRHHRLKTHGAWQVHVAEGGAWWWRSPHGHWFHVGPEGTQHQGRDPAGGGPWSRRE